MPRRLAILFAATAVLAMVACSPRPSPITPPGPVPTTAPPIAQPDGTFDVGGYSLYLHCQGSGSPTILYFHGWDNEHDSASSRSAASLPALLRDRYRFCAYDRPNVGASDSTPGLVTGAEQVRALHALLGAAGVDGPYLLLGASFGGLVAYDYLMNYPEGIQAMLLLDADFPDEVEYEHYFATENQLANRDWSTSEEKTNQYDVFTQAYAMRGAEPDIPMAYLAATPNLKWQRGVPGYDTNIVTAQVKFVAAFPRGVLENVPSPQYMEAAVPGVIVDHIDALVAQIP
ncbi:MAG: alpha/beta hydrolase [Pseudolysinimonas sp.]